MEKLIKEVCPVCQGSGEKSDYYDTFECAHCDGLGSIVTDEARELLALIHLATQACERSIAREAERQRQRNRSDDE